MKRISLIIIIGIVIFNGILYFSTKRNENVRLDIVAVNDIKETLAEHWDTLNADGLPRNNYGLDYTVLDQGNQLMGETRSGLDTDLNSAISHRDTIVDIYSGDILLGKLVIYNNTGLIWEKQSSQVFCLSLVALLLTLLANIFYSIYLKRTILLPFNKLQSFAKHVAEGNLDIPLKMDEGNRFGAFTESFDLMREELKIARENERAANLSKKELIASLSHDIKTPVASIKAVAEIMREKSQVEKDIKQLRIIDSKADQINTLMTNMFYTALEELQELKVAVTEEESLKIDDFIREADYHNLVLKTEQAECIVLMDPLRLSQVIDNIISNSYKYAGTKINTSMRINGKYLEVSFKDFGTGVAKEEMPLLFNKYYRARNATGKSGTGLGLYISKYLMEKMSGNISCENTDDGFTVLLKLLLA